MKNYIFLFLALSGCAGLSTKSRVEAPAESSSQAQDSVHQPSAMDEARYLLESRKFIEALDLYRQLQKDPATSSNIGWLKLGEAEALNNLGQPEGALVVFKNLIENSVGLNPELLATALLRSSATHEYLGNLDLAYAALRDAQSRKDDLPFELRSIELPYRLAAVLLRMNKIEKAKEYLKEVDENLRPYLDPNRKQTQWLASILFQLGQIGTQPRSFESFHDSSLQFRSVQKYFVRCMELNAAPWAELCFKQNQSRFFDIFQFVNTFKAQSFADPFVTKRVELEKKVSMSVDLKVLIQSTQALNSFADRGTYPQADMFFDFLHDLKKQVDDYLYSSPETTVLTEESLRLNGLKREGRMKE